ncbi:MAG: N-succinylarginine dihydrolase, partial [bacterium]|nr:N-succinylarginine dihydrolase [bacterium]
ASTRHRQTVSNPRAAALEGLEKMKALADLGLKQAVCPPHERPDVETLRQLGFRGTDTEVLARVAQEAPRILASCCSASGMWMANAATVSPSADTADGRVHFTPANLVTQFHRSLEPRATGTLLKAIFPETAGFAHHDPLPVGGCFSDEGAANHTRLCGAYHESGLEIFVYGKQGFDAASGGAMTFPARQSLEASRAIARLHGLDSEHTIFVRQNPDVIDAGVFHNDVIAVGNGPVFFYHTLAFAKGDTVIQEIQQIVSKCCGQDPILIPVSPDEVPVEDAVRSYLFNSQLVSLPNGTMGLIAPVECRENQCVAAFLAGLIGEQSPIREVYYVDVRQSMKNGGGPACLRLRVVLTETELDRMHQGVCLTNGVYEALRAWVARFYRDRLQVDDLADPLLLEESRRGLDVLTQILKLGSVYRFQQAGS